MRKLKTGAVTVSIVRFNVFVCCPIRKYLPDLVGLKREKEERVESRRHNPGDQTDFATLQQLAVSLCVCAIVFVSLQNESSECDSLEDSLDSLTHTSARPSYVSVSQEEEGAVRETQVYAVNKLAPLTIHYDKLMHIHRTKFPVVCGYCDGTDDSDTENEWKIHDLMDEGEVCCDGIVFNRCF